VKDNHWKFSQSFDFSNRGKVKNYRVLQRNNFRGAGEIAKGEPLYIYTSMTIFPTARTSKIPIEKEKKELVIVHSSNNQRGNKKEKTKERRIER
jgi:hypothetical protein